MLSKVLAWASMDCSATDVSRMLAEDAAEVREALPLHLPMKQKRAEGGRAVDLLSVLCSLFLEAHCTAVKLIARVVMLSL